MAGSVNRVTLLGRLGKDPESRSFQNGGKVVTFSVATSESWKDREGERQERTTWHNIVIWNEKVGEIAERYLRKGSEVYLEGQIETRKYQDQSGQDRYTTEIVLRPYRGELVLVGGRRDDEGGGERRESRSSPPRNEREGRMPSGRPGQSARRTDDFPNDDDIPF